MRWKPKYLDQVWAAALLCLIAVTWRLWIPRDDLFEIPMVDAITLLPPVIQWLPLAGIILPSIAIMIGGGRWLWWLVAASMVAAFLMNQHRLQPWAYQTAIYAVVFASMDRPSARKWLRPLAASIYLYSAAGKFDFQFAHTVGQQFLATVMNIGGGIPDWWSESTRGKLAMLLPAGEFLVGLGLLIPRTRQAAGGLAILFHLTLVVVLGPWGLSHSNGVLVWNVVLILQAYMLFVMPKSEADDEDVLPGRGSMIAKFAVLVALLAPLGERSGYWDHWPSWALYSPHSSRVRVEMHESAIAKLNPNLSSYFIEARDGERWSEFAMDQWSLLHLGVPIYPQARFQLAVADQFAEEHELGDAVRAIVRSVSDRRTGERTERRLIGESEVREELERYWLVGR